MTAEHAEPSYPPSRGRGARARTFARPADPRRRRRPERPRRAETRRSATVGRSRCSRRARRSVAGARRPRRRRAAETVRRDQSPPIGRGDGDDRVRRRRPGVASRRWSAEAVDRARWARRRRLQRRHRRRGGLSGATAETWDRVLLVNLRGAMLTAKAALPVLPTRRLDRVHLVARRAQAGHRIPSYDSSKAAMHGLMRHVAARRRAPQHAGQRRRAGPDGHVTRPRGVSGRPPVGREVAHPARPPGHGLGDRVHRVFLLSDESAYITGQVIAVDGGLTSLR